MVGMILTIRNDMTWIKADMLVTDQDYELSTIVVQKSSPRIAEALWLACSPGKYRCRYIPVYSIHIVPSRVQSRHVQSPDPGAVILFSAKDYETR